MNLKKFFSFILFSAFTFSWSQEPPALDAIKKSDLKNDIFELASDAMQGRRAGTINELRAAAWVAERAREAGMKPAGEDGTFFQFFPLYRTTVAEDSKITVDGKDLKLWKDVYEVSPVPVHFEETAVWLTPNDTTANLNNKVVAMKLLPPRKLPEEGMSLWVYRYALSAIRQQAATLKRQGAKAAILVADSTAYSKIGFFGHGLEEGKYEIDKKEWLKKQDELPVFIVTPEFEEKLKKNVKVKADVTIDKFSYPSANVIAKVEGTDARLKDEYVLFSGHHDHDGVGVPVEGDSIWNGADDNASVSVALLAIGRAWSKNPGKRSALFVWHGAEERGLFGSRYFVEHPVVKKEKINAVLNGDMIGRNESGNAALLGSIPPHKNSSELVEMAMDANEELTHFNVDTSWDAEDHPEFWYFRSDHLPYAQADIPAIFFTTLLHPDYHTPKDEPEKIDLEKLLEMTQWMYATGWKVSQSGKAPALDKNDSNSEK
ncbi:peptidase M28 [Christiangramia fulva]|uniref:Peptidase M28 n=1 Tax=Christiangramia fulva TaxID=2126553 RepID=A0A2R3Z0Z3_9FLAO|nr:M28 family peptidase [Christiangramia fulva]AVR43925.1 peptidase M28 [Christiangramia fulva]